MIFNCLAGSISIKQERLKLIKLNWVEAQKIPDDYRAMLIESKDQIEKCAELLKSNGLTTLRAGCFKPRTSPYSFQGLGLEGLKMLSDIRDKYGFNIISEVKDASHVDDVIEYTDIIQIGAKAMYDHGILRETGRQRKPVLLKRGFGSNLQEFVQAAEFILSEVTQCDAV